MLRKSILTCLSAGLLSFITVSGGTPGSISDELLNRFRQDNANPDGSSRALKNAMNSAAINTLAAQESGLATDDDFTYRVKSKDITDQKRSGRCWLFTGLNVLRGQAINQHDLGELKLSQVFNFFYDQLEKSNLFLQEVINTASDPLSDRRVEFLFNHPLSDGGTFMGVADLVMKYGVVPDGVMPETYTANNTSQFSKLLGWKLREMGLELRKMVDSGKPEDEVTKRKEEMLGEVYGMLVRAYGEPPTEFEWALRDSSGKPLEKRKYTPKEFYQAIFGNDLINDYVMLMNDPTRPYYEMYEIDLDRHSYDGQNWKYLNLPMEDVKKIAIESLKDSAMMYFSCDVSKYLNQDKGTLAEENFDYGALLGTSFNMDKRERIVTGASASAHAMTLVGVDIDDKSLPTRWLIENSWGNSGHKGHLIASDKWMDEYLFRLVVEKKFLPKKYLKLLDKKPTLLPAWDYMF